jgi:hypothetical protein
MRDNYKIKSWKRWQQYFVDSIEDFKTKHNRYPDLLLVSASTHKRINTAAAGLNGKYRKVDFFETDKYKLNVFIEEEVPNNSFDLSYILDEIP